MQGSFYGVISQTAFPDSAITRQAHGDTYMQFFPTVTGSAQNDETAPSSIIQLGSMQYPGPAPISTLQGLPNLANIAQPSSIPTIPLQPLHQISSASFGVNGMAGLGVFSTMSALPNMWPSDICNGASHTVPPLQSGVPRYPYLPNTVVSGQLSTAPQAALVGNRYSFSQSIVPDPPAAPASVSDEDSSTKIYTHRRLPASDWRKIMDMHKEDRPIKDIMSRFRISRSQVYRIIRLKGIKPNNRDITKRLGRPKGLSSEEIEQIREMCKDRSMSLTRMLNELIATKALPKVISVSTLSRILRSSPADD